MNVVVDVAGARMGGAARFASELYSYLTRTGRRNVRVIGSQRGLNPTWLLRREAVRPIADRRIALNNVSFVGPGGERWTLLRNALHFMTPQDASRLDLTLSTRIMHEARVVRFAATRSDVLVVPCKAMANRVTRMIPSASSKIVIRPHPVSPESIPRLPQGTAILCPVLFAPYKHMNRRLSELVTAVQDFGEPSVKILITANHREVTPDLLSNPMIEPIGQLDESSLRCLWARSRAIFFPTVLESFGYPLAEARVRGVPVIALESAQNREIAGGALRGFRVGDHASLVSAVSSAFTTETLAEPKAFDPTPYFEWLFGAA